MRIVSWNSSSSKFVRELPLIPMSKADIAVLHRVPKPLDEAEGGLRILWHGSSVNLGLAIIVNEARFPQAKTIQVGPGAMVVDLGGPSNLCVLAVDEMLAWLEISSRSPEVPSSASLAVTRQQLLKPYAETLASRTCVVLARHEMKAPRPGSPTSERQQVVRHLTERYDLHSAYHCQHFVRPAQELPPLRDSILIPGNWELEGVTCRQLALVVDCQPAKRDVNSWRPTSRKPVRVWATGTREANSSQEGNLTRTKLENSSGLRNSMLSKNRLGMRAWWCMCIISLIISGCGSDNARKDYASSAVEIKHQIRGGQFSEASYALDQFKVKYGGSSLESKYKVSARLRDYLSACATSAETREEIARIERMHVLSGPDPQREADKNKILELDAKIVRSVDAYLNQAIEAASTGSALPAAHSEL